MEDENQNQNQNDIADDPAQPELQVAQERQRAADRQDRELGQQGERVRVQEERIRQLEQEAVELEKQLEQKRQQFQQLEQAAAEQFEQEMRQQRQQLEQQLLEQERQQTAEREAKRERISSGTYYTAISALWDEKKESQLSEEEYRAIQRKQMPTHAGIFEVYNTTLQFALNDNSIVKDKKTESRSSNAATDEKEMIWPGDVVLNKFLGDIAHLAPADVTYVKTWWFLASWLYGEKLVPAPETFTFDFCMKILNGCGLIDSDISNTHRRRYCGVKHWTTNKARIRGQEFDVYDKNPCLLIVPILSPQQAVNWNGTGYSAIVVIDSWEQQKLDLRDVASGSGLRQDSVENDDLLANNEEVEQARALLERYLRGSLNAKRIARESPNFKFPKEYPVAYNIATEITVPAVNWSVPLASMKVRKVTFERFNLQGERNGGHPAPDPILLTAKAACVFSKRHGEAMAAGPGPWDYNDNLSDGDYAAMEQFIEAQQEALRPPDNWNDFARAMGQSGAAQPRDWSEQS